MLRPNATLGAARGALLRRNTCRICGSASPRLVLSFGNTPLANAFRTARQLDEPEESFPLDLFLCGECGLLQLLDVVDPELLFREYLYVSSTSPSFVEHFRRYAEELIRDHAIAPGSLVVELGSNDGVLLRHFKAAGMRVLGVDPAREIARAATASGIETLPEFFDRELAARIRQDHGAAMIVTANNVLAHVDDLHGLLEGVRQLLHTDGLLVFEVSYLLDVVEKSLFDMTYHEHLCYHAVRPLQHLLRLHGMEMIDAIRVPTHGGSLRGVAQLVSGKRKRRPSVDALAERENEASLDRADAFIRFGERIDGLKGQLRELLLDLKAQGRSLAGFGAPAKLTTLCHHFDIGPDLLDFIVDDSPLKQHRYTPGYHIPILPVSELYRRKPDYVIILAWNFAEQIIRAHEAYHRQGGRFIIPLPRVEVR